MPSASDNAGAELQGEERELAKKLADIVAKLNAMSEFKTLPHGSRLYRVAKGWETSIIESDPEVTTATTLGEFEKALRHNRGQVFIPEDALISEDGIEQVCQRNGVAKVIFKEVGTKNE